MNTKGPKKKKQHYVPKFYLRGFCGSGDTVFALDKESGGIFTPSVGDFCAERYLYESLSNDPNWYKGKFVYPNYTEDGLCELESAFAPVLKRVAALCVPNAPFTCVGDDDARIIASFVANAIARHPSVFKPLRNELMLSASEEDLSPYRDLMRALGHEGAFEGVAAEGVTRRLLLDTGDGSYQGLIVGELLENGGDRPARARVRLVRHRVFPRPPRCSGNRGAGSPLLSVLPYQPECGRHLRPRPPSGDGRLRAARRARCRQAQRRLLRGGLRPLRRSEGQADPGRGPLFRRG